jgi:hypothetical protein
MLIFYPRIKNGNILWSCDNCGNTAQVVYGGTNAVALVCQCDMKCHPECNNDWYYKGLYWERIPIEKRNDRR